MSGDELSSLTEQGRNWTSINRANDRADLAHRRHGGIIQPVAEVRRRPTLVSNGNFPFRIYNPHPCQLGVDFDQSAVWRTFLVRSGRINGTALTGNGCDGYDLNPDDDLYPQSIANDTGDAVMPVTFAIPDGTPSQFFFFWIDSSVAAQTNPNGLPLLYTGDQTQIPDVWDSYPNPDATHYLIGSVNLTAADPVNQVLQSAVIRQILRADIIAAPGASGLPVWL